MRSDHRLHPPLVPHPHYIHCGLRNQNCDDLYLCVHQLNSDRCQADPPRLYSLKLVPKIFGATVFHLF